jgi:hypothetical protein
MKKINLLLIALGALLVSCQSKTTTVEVTADTTALTFPFKAKYPTKWEKGDDKNTVIILNCLKKYLAGDIKGSVENFGDTVEFISDQYHFKGSRDSLAAILGQLRGEYATITKEFDTWLAAYYPESKETWVTLWYTEKWTDKNGKADSLYYTDDVMLKDGKILVYDEKSRRFPLQK